MQRDFPAYHLDIKEQSGYLQATVVGPRTPENAMRFLREVQAACVERGQTAVLLEMNLSGPSLDAGSIFGVISSQSPAATTLQRIAYVETSLGDPDKARFAETVAVNRGVNVRLFGDVASAHRWLREGT